MDGLRVEGVRKRFGTVEVLRGVSLVAPDNGFLVLLGPSGCGKTTLLRIVAGLERADAGRVTLGGVDLTPLPAHQRPVNTVFQSYALFPHLDVHENVAFGLRARGIADSEVRRCVANTLELLRIGEFARRQTHQLSGGQKQRVALARALVNEPQLLLLDEPLSALDAKLRAEVQVELKRLQRRLGTGFLLVTHDQDEAMTLADRLVLMREGVIEQEGTPEAVYDRPRTAFAAAFLGAANLLSAERCVGGLQTCLGTIACAVPDGFTSGRIAVRPERLQVGDHGAVYTVSDVVYRGDHVNCLGHIAGVEVRVRLAADRRPVPHDRLHLTVAPEHVVVLDA